MNKDLFMDRAEFIDRPRGILTKQQREHLTGGLNEDPEEDSDKIRMRERRIRQHLRHSLIDFQILAKTYDGLLEPVFADLMDPETNPLTADDPLRGGIEGVFTLLYRALLDFDFENGVDDHVFNLFLDRGVSEAVEWEYARRGFSVEPAFTLFKVHGTEPAVSVGQLKEEYDQGERLFMSEVKDLYWAGEISYEEYQDYDSFADLETLEEEHDEGAVDVYQSLFEERSKQREEVAVEDAPVEPEYAGFYQDPETDD